MTDHGAAPNLVDDGSQKKRGHSDDQPADGVSLVARQQHPLERKTLSASKTHTMKMPSLADTCKSRNRENQYSSRRSMPRLFPSTQMQASSPQIRNPQKSFFSDSAGIWNGLQLNTTSVCPRVSFTRTTTDILLSSDMISH